MNKPHSHDHIFESPPPTLEKPIPQMTNYMIFTNLFQKEGSIVYLDA